MTDEEKINKAVNLIERIVLKRAKHATNMQPLSFAVSVLTLAIENVCLRMKKTRPDIHRAFVQGVCACLQDTLNESEPQIITRKQKLIQ